MISKSDHPENPKLCSRYIIEKTVPCLLAPDQNRLYSNRKRPSPTDGSNGSSDENN